MDLALSSEVNRLGQRIYVFWLILTLYAGRITELIVETYFGVHFISSTLFSFTPGALIS